MSLSDAESAERRPEQPRHTPPAWRVVIAGLDVLALIAAHTQHEGPAVVAKALAVLGQSAVDAWTARR